MIKGLTRCGVLAFAFASALSVDGVTAATGPVQIRMGVGPSSEEVAWLMKARPDLTPNQGKLYTYDMTLFRSVNERTLAFEGGQLDAATSSSTGIIFAAAKGVAIKVVASMGADSERAFSNSFLALVDSAVSLENLNGKRIGLNGYRTSFDLYAHIAAKKAGLNPDRDIRFVIVPLPQMGDALRTKKIDIGVFPSIFAQAERTKGGVKTVFTSAGISGLEEEFDIYFSPKFLSEHPDAAKAWGADYVKVLTFMREHPQEARQSLLDARIMEVNPAFYLSMTPQEDLYRVADGRPDPQMFAKLQDLMFEFGFIKNKVDIDALIDRSVLPNP